MTIVARRSPRAVKIARGATAQEVRLRPTGLANLRDRHAAGAAPACSLDGGAAAGCVPLCSSSLQPGRPGRLYFFLPFSYGRRHTHGPAARLSRGRRELDRKAGRYLPLRLRVGCGFSGRLGLPAPLVPHESGRVEAHFHPLATRYRARHQGTERLPCYLSRGVHRGPGRRIAARKPPARGAPFGAPRAFPRFP